MWNAPAKVGQHHTMVEKRNATVYLHAKGLAQSVTYREDVEVTLALTFHYTSSLCAFLPATF
jgi:hypothetical protein